MDMASIVRFEVENTRKSLGRRVSFANHAHVRLFEVPEQNTNSTASPQSSPAADVENRPATNDENVYPGASSFRRRSSIRRSIAFSEGGGEESMDMDSDDTGYSPAAFFKVGHDVEEGDDLHDFGDEGDYPDDDMDVTEAIPRNIIRQRSLSLGVPRQPLANLTSPQALIDEQDEEVEEAPIEHDSAQSQSVTSEDNASQLMEFTVPLIRPHRPPSDAWLALRAATHSGDTPYIPSSDDEEQRGVQDMELTDAVSRLQAARTSIGLGNGDGEEGQPDSFNSTEDSFAEENSGISDEGNQTVNVTQLMRRVSLATSTHDSTMEVTTLYSAQGYADASASAVIPADSSEVPQPAPPTAVRPSPIPPDTQTNLVRSRFMTHSKSLSLRSSLQRNLQALPQKNRSVSFRDLEPQLPSVLLVPHRLPRLKKQYLQGNLLLRLPLPCLSHHLESDRQLLLVSPMDGQVRLRRLLAQRSSRWRSLNRITPNLLQRTAGRLLARRRRLMLNKTPNLAVD